MYKAIIVDDEKAVRERLIKLFSNFSNDFEVVGVFENGYDALTNGTSLGPDLLITDIKMPYINGLELIKRMKLELPLLESIIISGFDNFDYAKEAISLGVTGYITKPVTINELNEVLIKVKKDLDGHYLFDGESISNLEKKLSSATKLIQNKDLSLLITMKELSATFKEKLKTDGISFDEENILLGVIDYDKEVDQLTYKEIEASDLILEKIIKESIDKSSLDYIKYIIFKNQNETCIFLLSDMEIKKQELEKVFTQIVAKVYKGIGVSLSIGFSEIEKNTESLSYRKLYRHAKRVLEYRTIVSPQIVMFFDDINTTKSSTFKIDDNEYKKLSYEILYGNEEVSKQMIENIFLMITRDTFKDTYYFILNNLIDSMLKSCVSLKSLYESYMPHIDILKKAFSLKSNEGIRIFFEELLHEIIVINKENRVIGIESSFNQIKAFINNNYSNPLLSLDDIAKEFSYSSSYISAILKKNNTSFIKYLTDIRMKEAIGLLTRSNEKLITIANQIGYEDPYYFSHCFKKYYGISPQEYRKEYEKKQNN